MADSTPVEVEVRCEDVWRRRDAIADGEWTGADSHLATCPACREFLNYYQAWRDILHPHRARAITVGERRDPIEHLAGDSGVLRIRSQWPFTKTAQRTATLIGLVAFVVALLVAWLARRDELALHLIAGFNEIPRSLQWRLSRAEDLDWLLTAARAEPRLDFMPRPPLVIGGELRLRGASAQWRIAGLPTVALLYVGPSGTPRAVVYAWQYGPEVSANSLARADSHGEFLLERADGLTCVVCLQPWLPCAFAVVGAESDATTVAAMFYTWLTSGGRR